MIILHPLIQRHGDEAKMATGKTNNIVKASEAIPTLCRVPLLYVEPIFALAGVALLLVDPVEYISRLTRGYGGSSYTSSQQFIYTQRTSPARALHDLRHISGSRQRPRALARFLPCSNVLQLTESLQLLLDGFMLSSQRQWCCASWMMSEFGSCSAWPSC